MSDAAIFLSLLAAGAVGLGVLMQQPAGVGRGDRQPAPVAAPGAPAAAADGRPRGIRNNNPGNIEWSRHNDWAGQIGSDGRYSIFSDPVYGIRAMARILDVYRGRGLETLEQIINTWAPPSENPTGAYIGYVRQRTGLSAQHLIGRADYHALIPAMIYMENGQQPYSDNQIAAGIAAALGG